MYPAEVENVLRQHPAIAAISVAGVPDREWGERVAAMIVLHSGKQLTVNDLLNFGRQRLAGYKLPRLVQFVDKLPLTSAGKIHRQQVRAVLQGQNRATAAESKADSLKNF